MNFINTHPFKSFLESKINDIFRHINTLHPEPTNPIYFRKLDENINVYFDDIHTPCINNNSDDLKRLLDELFNLDLNKYNCSSVRHIIDRLRDGYNGIILEKHIRIIYQELIEWLVDDSRCYDNCDPFIKNLLKKIRKALLSVGHNRSVAGLYDGSTKTITLFTQVLGNDETAYLTTFAHEIFHAYHHKLFDPRFLKHKYYESVVFESLATFFEISYARSLKTIDGDRIASGRSYPDEPSLMLFDPYSGVMEITDDAIFSRILFATNDFKEALYILLTRDIWLYPILLKIEKKENWIGFPPSYPIPKSRSTSSSSSSAGTSISSLKDILSTCSELTTSTKCKFRNTIEALFFVYLVKIKNHSVGTAKSYITYLRTIVDDYAGTHDYTLIYQDKDRILKDLDLDRKRNEKSGFNEFIDFFDSLIKGII